MGETMSRQAPRRSEALAVSLLLGIVTFVLYWPVTHYPFISYDDPTYITANDHVLNGLSWSGLRWALTSAEGANWHPLTWVSHQLDASAYGNYPGGHHLTSLLLHVANTVLLFLVLRRMSGTLWPSALVAALFGWHPLHVESVAWGAERKDVLR